MPQANWRYSCVVSQQAQSICVTIASKQKFTRRIKCSLRASINEYILDHQSQNHSPKTIEWHTLALGKLAVFLEKQGVTYIEDIERVHLLSWLTVSASEPGSIGKIGG